MNYYGNCFSSINKLARGMLILVFVFLAVFSYPVQVAQATDDVFDIHELPQSSIDAAPKLSIINKVLTANKAIAAWLSDIPVGEKRPVLAFLPGWGGTGSVNASVSSQNTSLVNEGYVTLAIGFDSSGTWVSDIAQKTLDGLDKLCVDVSIPANCNAIILVGSSYGGAQNYWVIEFLRSNGYDGGMGSKGKALGFLSEDAGYGTPGILTDPVTGAFTRTGLADTASYSVAMIENLGDTTFPVDECTWGNCGARELSNAHLARGDNNVFSVCPPGGEHGTRDFANWDAWVISAVNYHRQRRWLWDNAPRRRAAWSSDN